jgi:hypothetical protein
MKLDTDPFLANVNAINFEEVKILVRPQQADSTRGKNVVVSDELRPRMLKPRSPEPGVWKTNQRRWAGPRVTPTSDTLIEKYTRQRRITVFQRLGHRKRERSPELLEVYGRCLEAGRRVMRTTVDMSVW